MPKKLIISIAIVTFTLLILLCLLFYPLFNLKSSVKGTQSNTDYVINWYNPLKPKLTSITKLSGSDGYMLVVSDYNRTGLFSYEYAGEVNGNKKPQDFAQANAQIANKSLDEVKQIAKTQDLSTKPYTPEKSDLEKQYEEEKKKPPLCQKILDYGDQELSDLNKSQKLFKAITLGEIDKIFLGKGVGEVSNIYIYNLPVRDSKVIKLRLFFDTSKWETKTEYENIKLTKATKVFSDCHEEEIPLPDKPAAQ